MAMNLLDHIRRLFRHAFEADLRLLDALRAHPDAEAVREFAHVVGTYENWLARIEARTPRLAIWPEAPLDEVGVMLERAEADYVRYLNSMREDDFTAQVSYANSAGQEFTNTAGDILLHVVLHAQYHRGKVNLLLRQSGGEPAPADFIAFVRGAPAATQATHRG